MEILLIAVHGTGQIISAKVRCVLLSAITAHCAAISLHVTGIHQTINVKKKGKRNFVTWMVPIHVSIPIESATAIGKRLHM